jgi:hypothetical protein
VPPAPKAKPKPKAKKKAKGPGTAVERWEPPIARNLGGGGDYIEGIVAKITDTLDRTAAQATGQGGPKTGTGSKAKGGGQAFDWSAFRRTVDVPDVEVPQSKEDGDGKSDSTYAVRLPNTRSGGGPGLDRTTGTRFIIVISGVCFLAIVLHSKGGNTTTTDAHGKNVVVSTKLRSYAALVVVTIVCLVINEFSPPFAVGLMLLLLFDLAVSTGLFDLLAKAITGGPVTVGSGPTLGPAVPIPGNQGGRPAVPGSNIPGIGGGGTAVVPPINP